MKMVLGSPGTRSGLFLRTGQITFAGVSIAVMLSAFGFANYTAFCYLVASMGLQALWSLGLACLDIYAIKVKRDLHNHLLVSLFVVGDWVTGTLSLAAACSSAGVTVLFVRDTDFCKSFPQLSCGKLQVSTAMAFITWMFVSASALVMSWILTSS
ncbi:CASP-like protein 5B3 [Zingiber officinale]|uniref:CASP-like protein 5B3 n=1 Tax=Zingiber officinale TaxID=94328 RepID=UPI001C4B5A10|nr:CASP-like protein 5B3 [Zingiber officinale]